MDILDPTQLAKAMDFAVRFTPAIVKLRNAELQEMGVTLTAEEVSALIEGFQVLRDGPSRSIS